MQTLMSTLIQRMRERVSGWAQAMGGVNVKRINGRADMIIDAATATPELAGRADSPWLLGISLSTKLRVPSYRLLFGP